MCVLVDCEIEERHGVDLPRLMGQEVVCLLQEVQPAGETMKEYLCGCRGREAAQAEE